MRTIRLPKNDEQAPLKEYNKKLLAGKKIKDLAIELGLHPHTITRRLRRGVRIDAPRLKLPGTVVEISERADAAGIKPATVLQRLYHGWDLERALNTPPKQLDHGVAKLARKHGLDPYLVWQRIHRGHSLKEALDPHVHSRRKFIESEKDDLRNQVFEAIEHYIAQNKEPPSMRWLAKEIGIHESSIFYRLRKMESEGRVKNINGKCWPTKKR